MTIFQDLLPTQDLGVGQLLNIVIVLLLLLLLLYSDYTGQNIVFIFERKSENFHKQITHSVCNKHT